MLDATFHALAEPRRREILRALGDRELTAGEIAARFDGDPPGDQPAPRGAPGGAAGRRSDATEHVAGTGRGATASCRSASGSGRSGTSTSTRSGWRSRRTAAGRRQAMGETDMSAAIVSARRSSRARPPRPGAGGPSPSGSSAGWAPWPRSTSGRAARSAIDVRQWRGDGRRVVELDPPRRLVLHLGLGGSGGGRAGRARAGSR